MYAESTPNPLAMKFVLGKPIVEGSARSFDRNQNIEGIPVLEDLFSLPGVEAILLTQEFITVTKTPDSSWNLLEGVILSALHFHLDAFPLKYWVSQEKSENNSCPIASDLEPGMNREENAFYRDLEDLIDGRIRPAIEADGGIIDLRGFKDGVVYVQLRGACTACPHADETLKEGIERMLTYYLPEVQRVEVIDTDI